MVAYSQTYAYDRLGNIDERQEKTCNPTCGPLWNVYDYSYGSKPQAVTSVGGQGSYSYDTNGNMSGRTEGGITYTQIYDVENRLVSVMGGGSSTTFAYDASGQRVKTMATTPGNSRTITYYPFPNYEEEQQQTWYPGVCFATCPGSWMTDVTVKRSLYGLAGQAMATRVVSSPGQSTDGLFYFLEDHLGSTRLLTNTSGTPITDTKAHFLPYGSYRGDEPVSEITDTGFTGHKHNDSLGLIYMNARFYVPNTNRFLTPDSIVPDPADPQSYNRYSYVRNNPIMLVDPSGHCYVSPEGERICPPLPTPSPTLPTTPPEGLTDRPYGSDEAKSKGPGGKQAWEALMKLQATEGWWGAELDAQEAMILVLSGEFNSIIGQRSHGTWSVPPEAIEAAIRKYNQFCSGGPWTADCFNGFWAYMQSITDFLINQTLVDDRATNPRYTDTAYMAQYRSMANTVMSSPEIGGQRLERPSDWANASSSLAVNLAAYPELSVYFNPGADNFAIYTRSQYYELKEYQSCTASSEICLAKWID